MIPLDDARVKEAMDANPAESMVNAYGGERLAAMSASRRGLVLQELAQTCGPAGDGAIRE